MSQETQLWAVTAVAHPNCQACLDLAEDASDSAGTLVSAGGHSCTVVRAVAAFFAGEPNDL